MKRIILSALFLMSFLAASESAMCTPTEDLTKNSKPIKDTTIKTVVYKIYEGSKGGRFIIVTSRSGNQYKKYLKK